MAFKCVIHGRATILRESGRRTFNHSTGGKSQLCHARGGNSRTTRQSFAKYHMGIKTGETKLLGAYRGTNNWTQ